MQRLLNSLPKMTDVPKPENSANVSNPGNANTSLVGVIQNAICRSGNKEEPMLEEKTVAVQAIVVQIKHSSMHTLRKTYFDEKYFPVVKTFYNRTK